MILTGFIANSVGLFTDLVNDNILLKHEFVEFSNFFIHFLTVCAIGVIVILNMERYFLFFVEVCDESCLGLICCCLCLPLDDCLVEDS